MVSDFSQGPRPGSNMLESCPRFLDSQASPQGLLAPDTLSATLHSASNNQEQSFQEWEPASQVLPLSDFSSGQ